MSDRQDQTQSTLKSQRVKEAEAKARTAGVGFSKIDDFALMAVSELAAKVEYVASRRNSAEAITGLLLDAGVSAETIQISIIAALESVTEIYSKDTSLDHLNAKDKANEILSSAYDAAGNYIPEAERASFIAARAELAAIDAAAAAIPVIELAEDANLPTDFAVSEHMVPAELRERLDKFKQELDDFISSTHPLARNHGGDASANPYNLIAQRAFNIWVFQGELIEKRLENCTERLIEGTAEHKKIIRMLTEAERKLNEIKEELEQMSVEKEPAADTPLGGTPASGPSNLGEAQAARELTVKEHAFARMTPHLSEADAEKVVSAKESRVKSATKKFLRGLNPWYSRPSFWRGASFVAGQVIFGAFMYEMGGGGRNGELKPEDKPKAPAAVAQCVPGPATISAPVAPPMGYHNTPMLKFRDAADPKELVNVIPMARFRGKSREEIIEVLKIYSAHASAGLEKGETEMPLAMPRSDIRDYQVFTTSGYTLENHAALDIVATAIDQGLQDLDKQAKGARIQYVLSRVGTQFVLYADPKADGIDATELFKQDAPADVPAELKPATPAPTQP